MGSVEFFFYNVVKEAVRIATPYTERQTVFSQIIEITISTCKAKRHERPRDVTNVTKRIVIKTTLW